MDYLQGIYIVLIVIAVILALYLITTWVTLGKVTSTVNNISRGVQSKLQSLAPYSQNVGQLWAGLKSEIGKVNPTATSFLNGIESHLNTFLKSAGTNVAAGTNLAPLFIQ